MLNDWHLKRRSGTSSSGGRCVQSNAILENMLLMDVAEPALQAHHPAILCRRCCLEERHDPNLLPFGPPRQETLQTALGTLEDEDSFTYLRSVSQFAIICIANI